MAVAFENQNTVAGTGVKRSRDQPPRPEPITSASNCRGIRAPSALTAVNWRPRTGYGIDLDQCDEFD
jgi:hypothetical protein